VVKIRLTLLRVVTSGRRQVPTDDSQWPRTSSDDENVWMAGINADFGFVPVESEVLVHRRRRR
jgi:hypothetical protein